jgi:hypothetical protein
MTACPRAFEVEALRDGRLTGAERSAFERHLAGCAACAREFAAFERLASALRDGPAGTTDDLHARRERTRLLAAFDRALIGRPTPSESRVSRRTVAGLATAAAFGAAASAVWFRAGRERPASPASAVTVRPVTGARWSRRTSAGREQIVLDEGRLWIQVRRAGSEVPLLVVLPDGELEDVGTTFTVTAESGRTTSVAVEEGSVILRLRGQAPRSIGPLGSWSAPEAAASIGPTREPLEKSPTTASPARPSAATASPARPSAATALPARPSAAAALPAPQASGPPEPLAPSAASEAFKAAMAALNRGDARDAAARFSAFLDEFPRDPRAEDASYLRVLAHQRAGNSAELQRAARAYLARYPAGFRRREVAALLSVP